MGGEMSGSRSTRSWLYENRPRTHSAAMTMVAKTGLLIETRVNHMACVRQPLGRRRRRRRGESARRRRRACSAALRDDAGRCAFLQVVEACREDLRFAADALAHLDAAGRRVLAAGDDETANQRPVLDRPDEVLPRR